MLAPLAALLVCAVPDAGLPPASPQRQAMMHAMFEALVGLQPAVVRPERLRDKALAAEAIARLETLSQLKHAFPEDSKAQEPATAVLSTFFARYAKETQQKVERGELGSVPLRVNTMASLCFTCHSRERVPVDFNAAEGRLEALNLTALDKARLFAAVREFDKALEVYRAVLAAPPKGERSLFEFARTLRETLTLLVRVKDDAAGTAALLDGLAKRADLPPHFQRTIASWRKDVTAWQQEKFTALTATPAQLFERAQRLVERANGTRVLLTDETTEVLYLRAGAYLNLALAKEPTLAQRGEALLLLGVCAAALKSPLFWDVDTLFFEACVRENPHRPIARRCYRQLSDRLTFGFTGSGGTNIPEDDLERLAELRGLAEEPRKEGP